MVFHPGFLCCSKYPFWGVVLEGETSKKNTTLGSLDFGSAPGAGTARWSGQHFGEKSRSVHLRRGSGSSRVLGVDSFSILCNRRSFQNQLFFVRVLVVV